MRVIRWPADTSPFFCFRSKRVDRGLFYVHDEHLSKFTSAPSLRNPGLKITLIRACCPTVESFVL